MELIRSRPNSRDSAGIYVINARRHHGTNQGASNSQESLSCGLVINARRHHGTNQRAALTSGAASASVINARRHHGTNQLENYHGEACDY